MTAIQSVVAAMKKLEAEIAEIGHGAIIGQAMQVFEAMPEVTAIGWTQGTPSFNDGDPCVFSVHEIGMATEPITLSKNHFTIDGDEMYEVDEDFFKGPWSRAYDQFPKDNDKERTKACAQFETNLEPMTGIPEEIFRKVFGESNSIVITREGEILVNDYEMGY